MKEGKTKKKKASAAKTRRTIPVVPGAADTTEAPTSERAPTGDNAPEERVEPPPAAGAGSTPAAARPGVNEITESMQEISLDPSEYRGAPALTLLVFLSKDPLSRVRRDRRRAALVAQGVSGTRPEDMKISTVKKGNSSLFRVSWREHESMHEATHILGRIADEDQELAQAMNQHLRKKKDWQTFDVLVPFQTEGFCRKYPGLEIALPHEQERRWMTAPIKSLNQLDYQAQMSMITAFELAEDNDEARLRHGDTYQVEDMGSPTPAAQRRSPSRRSRSSRRSHRTNVTSRSASRSSRRSKTRSRSNAKKKKKKSSKKDRKDKQYRESLGMPAAEEAQRNEDWLKHLTDRHSAKAASLKPAPPPAPATFTFPAPAPSPFVYTTTVENDRKPAAKPAATPMVVETVHEEEQDVAPTRLPTGFPLRRDQPTEVTQESDGFGNNYGSGSSSSDSSSSDSSSSDDSESSSSEEEEQQKRSAWFGWRK